MADVGRRSLTSTPEMRFTPLVAASAAAAVASAQNQTTTVEVGGTSGTTGGPLQFIPNTITAPNGTVVTFKFSGIPGNHSVTQSSFDSPCQPLEGGFDSGWVEILRNSTDGTLPEWSVTITNDQTPIWFYCKQLKPVQHCTSGMLGAINVKPGEKSFSAFQAVAAAATSVAPGQAQGGLVGVGASASEEPVVPSAFATLFRGASATATAPAGSHSAALWQLDPPNLNLLAIVGGILMGAAMVL
ncbi:hypothetical protein B0H14DRAFT_3520417 [Mycena olivaceomarginata]|nr:hypothetical protein B0H14DRAFT_3520417 [Mycena olivaceomarginata]